MGIVQQILDRNSPYDTEIMGLDFRLNPLSGDKYFAVMGPQGFGIIRGAIQEADAADAAGEAASKLDDMDDPEVRKAYAELLEVVMIVPALGEVTSIPDGIIAFGDMGRDLPKHIINDALTKSGVLQQVKGFPESSEDAEGETTQ